MQKYIWHVQFTTLTTPEPRDLNDLYDLEVEAKDIEEALAEARADLQCGACHILEIRRGKRAQ